MAKRATRLGASPLSRAERKFTPQSNKGAYEMIFAILITGFAAILGLAMAVPLITRSRNPAWSTAIAHGLVAVVGVVTVLWVLIGNSELLVLQSSLAFFLAAAVVGLGLLSRHLRGREIPVRFVIVHAALGVLGFTLLVVSAFLVRS